MNKTLTTSEQSNEETDESLRIKVAELCGWNNPRFINGKLVMDFHYKHLGVQDCSTFDYVPDYPNDLNAMHEAEKAKNLGIMGAPLFNKFELELAEICFQEGKRRSIIHATARQRAEAFVKTLAKKDL